jgi:hypothetical protein
MRIPVSICFVFCLLPFGLSAAEYEVDCKGSYFYGEDVASFEPAFLEILESRIGSIPKLSPSEEEWLKGEIKSNDTGRQERAMSSRENSLFKSRSANEAMYNLVKDSTIVGSQKYLKLLSYLIDYEDNGRIYMYRLLGDRIIVIEDFSESENKLVARIDEFGMTLEKRDSHLIKWLQQHILNCFIPSQLNKENHS